jgi:hypothetical protein
MGQAALEAGANAVLTFLEAEFTGEDVTRLSAPPGGRLPADAVYFRIGDESGVLGTVGATPDFLQGASTTDLVERLHLDDLPGAVRKAGAGQCVMLVPGKPPTAVPLA